MLKAIDRSASAGRVGRNRALEDFLTLSVCALSGGQMEDEYLAVVKHYSEGPKGHRGADYMVQAFGELVSIMEETRADILGDLFQGAVSFGDAGQFFTPESVCELMAQITGPDGGTVLDSCCGSGRLLLAASVVNPHRELVGQDVDLRCVRITAINLALRGLYGYAIWGDSLALEQRLVYRIGFNGRGFIRLMDAARLPEIVRSMAQEHSGDELPVLREQPMARTRRSHDQISQLRLF